VGLIDEKTEGQKSRETVPSKSIYQNTIVNYLFWQEIN
jgi:hypothetical protein